MDRSLVFGIERVFEAQIVLAKGNISEYIELMDEVIFQEKVHSMMFIQAYRPPEEVLNSPEWRAFEARIGFHIYHPPNGSNKSGL